jgi:hypothetical protein
MPLTLSSLPDSVDVAAKQSKTLSHPMVEAGISRFQSSLVPAQIAALNTAITSNTSSLNQLLESVAVAGVISSIGHPANQDVAGPGLGAMVAAMPLKDAPPIVQHLSNALPIVSLSDVAIGYPVLSQVEITSPAFNLGQRLVSTQANGSDTSFIDLSLVPLGTPVAITQLSDAQNRVTVIDGNATTVRIADFKLAPGLPELFINTNLATLNLAVPTTSLSTLNSPERIDFKVTGIEIGSGITVSGTADASVAAVEMNAIAVNFASEITPLFLAELSNIPAGELQIRLLGTVTFTDEAIIPGTLILGG